MDVDVPDTPVPLDSFIPHLREQLDAGRSVAEILAPFKAYEGRLRELFAQEPDNPILSKPNANMVPLFAGREGLLNAHARQLDKETPAEKEKYILPLDETWRKPHGAPATVQSLKAFRNNFTLFSESSLAELDWSNVVAAGSSVVTPLLPVPEKHSKTKRARRTYYHEKLAPASDVDLFIYGLNEEQAIEKIKQIEASIRDSILEETTAIRTKNTITIVSKYPVRHVQIVLRLYKNISEILTGFDVDCACVAYDGSQVWATPRAVTSLITQTNTIDLSRRSPSYESRLAKYRHRGFEVYWPDLDRSKIDPTIFERAFSHVVGLAKLLVLEKLPTQGARDEYLAKRQAERGAPRKITYNDYSKSAGHKDRDPEDVAEWFDEDDVSSYHTITIPYGPGFYAKKIEKLLFKKDLLLNAEWNKSKERKVDLHRHPAFFGTVESIVKDCCGTCPPALTDEDKEVAEQESKWFISGDLEFMKDDPGRQAIGSFHPITDTDWTEMAYLSDTARLCQAIVDGDLKYVQDWCANEDNAGKIDSRDHSGRTPLHLATICGNFDIAKCLIDNGARIVARVGGGFTALHMAAYLGHAEVVKALLEKSEHNKSMLEAQPESREETSNNQAEDEDTPMSEASDASFVMSGMDSTVKYATTKDSFVKVETVKEPTAQDEQPNDEDPDIYDVDVLAWDIPVSPLHLAIIHGHTDIIDILASTFGANPSLAVWSKSRDPYDYDSSFTASLPLSLPLSLPPAQSLAVTKALLELGVSSTQADKSHITGFHQVVAGGTPETIDALFDLDGAAAKHAINHPAGSISWARATIQVPLATAIRRGDTAMVTKLLEHGARGGIRPKSLYPMLSQLAQAQERRLDPRSVDLEYMPPVIMAVLCHRPDIANLLLEKGIDPNTMDNEAHKFAKSKEDVPCYAHPRTLLDYVDERIAELSPQFEKLKDDEEYLSGLADGSFRRHLGKTEVHAARLALRIAYESHEKGAIEVFGKGLSEADAVARIAELKRSFSELRDTLVSKGAKKFKELHPQIRIKRAEPKEPFELKFGARREKKLERLFEAVWTSDIDTVKALTLPPAGNTQDQPLHVSTRNNRHFSAFAVAILHGDHRMIKLILEIAALQYAPPSAGIWASSYPSISDSDDAEGSENYDSDEYDSEEKEKEQDRTTVDVREAPSTIPSRDHPLDILMWTTQFWRFRDDWETHAREILGDGDAYFVSAEMQDSVLRNKMTNLSALFYTMHWTPLRYAIEKGDLELVNLLLDLMTQYSTPKGDKEHDKWIPRVELNGDEFEAALKLGRVDILTALVEKAGAGIPLDRLVKGLEEDSGEGKKYYTGLSVHGKKRHDWTSAINRFRSGLRGITAPVLAAVFHGSLETVKWFLSDEPLKLYIAYAQKRKAFENVEDVLSKWWNMNRDLAIYCAIMAPPSKHEPSNLSRLQLILDQMPHAFDTQAFHGTTPLHLAFHLRRYSAAKHLIERGANQALRDKQGRSVLHHLLDPDAEPALPASMFAAFWDLLDPALARSLATERMRGPAEAEFPLFYTPLAYWLSNETDSDDKKDTESSADLLRTILSKSNGAGLRVLDAAGNYPMHVAIRKRQPKLARVLLEFNPSMLGWENATGKTPLDILDREAERETLDFARRLSRGLGERYVVYKDNGKGVEWRMDEKVEFWRDVREMKAKLGMKVGRRLASVFEANQLVRSLEVYREARERKERESEREKEREERESEGGQGQGRDEDSALGELGSFLRDARSEEENYEVEEF